MRRAPKLHRSDEMLIERDPGLARFRDLLSQNPPGPDVVQAFQERQAQERSKAVIAAQQRAKEAP